MANTLKNQLNTMINRRKYFEAVVMYLNHVGESLAEMEPLLHERTDEVMQSFLQYKNIWDIFCAKTLEGDFDGALSLMDEYKYETEMGVPEQKTILFVLAETSGNYNTYRLYWQLVEQDTLEAHQGALGLLSDCLPDCPEALPEIKKHLYWVIERTEKRELVKILEGGLKLYNRPRPLISTAVATDLVVRLRALQPKNKEANKADMEIIRRDFATLEIVRPLVDAEEYEQAIDRGSNGRGTELVRRAFVRGAFENKKNPERYIEALEALYKRTQDPEDQFYAAYAVWNCPLREDEEYLAKSMEQAEDAIARLEEPNRYIISLLDQLYLLEPYPLSDEKAEKYAKIVLIKEPENEIAKESLAIAKEQMNA